MSHCSRRNFLKAGVAAVPFVGAASLQIKGATGTATDWVTLGRSDVKVTRLAFGTGTMSGKVQRDLGQEQFTPACALRLRPWYSILRNRRVVWRDAQNARSRAQGNPSR